MSKEHIRKQTFTLSSQEDGHGQYIITSLVSFYRPKKEVWSLCIFSKYEKRGSSWAFMGPKSFTHMTNGVEQRFVSPVISTNLERSFFPASVIENEL